MPQKKKFLENVGDKEMKERNWLSGIKKILRVKLFRYSLRSNCNPLVIG